jgi:hypothetical protein
MSHRPGPVRLGCLYCDRTDFDGVAEIPDDWSSVQEVQSYTESIEPVSLDEHSTRSVLDWQTHLGVCPDCRALYGD